MALKDNEHSLRLMIVSIEFFSNLETDHLG